MQRKKIRIWIKITGGVTVISAVAILIIIAVILVPYVYEIMIGENVVDQQEFIHRIVVPLIAPSVTFYPSLIALFILSVKNGKLKRTEMAQQNSTTT